MDLSHHSIYTALASLLARSQDFQVWYEEHEKLGLLEPWPLIHAVKPKEHYVVRLMTETIRVQNWDRLVGDVVLEVALEDPEAFPSLEKFFGVRSADDPARPVDPMAAIAAMID